MRTYLCVPTYLFIGHPKGAIHIAWVDEPDWKVNPLFVTEVRKVMLEGIILDDEDKEHPMDAAPVLLIYLSQWSSFPRGGEKISQGRLHQDF